MNSKTSLRLGPLLFTHEVQDISIQERKFVDIINIPRSSETSVVDGNASYKKIQVRLLITGLEEISIKLAQLVALFKISPIVSVKNETISSFCKEESSQRKKDIKFTSSRKDNKSTISESVYREPISTEVNSIPVAVESLTIRTVPDLVDTVSVELELTRVAILRNSRSSSYFSDDQRAGYMEYLDENGNPTFNEDKAYWLKKWIDHVSKVGTVVINSGSINDFSITNTRITDQTIEDVNSLEVFHFKGSATIAAFSIRLKNFFAFHKMQASPIPSVQYIGSSNISVAIDATFLTRTENETKVFNKFCTIKDRSEQSSTTFGLFNDVTQGWTLNNKLIDLVNQIVKQTQDKFTKTYYCPIQVVLNTGNVPDLKSVSIDFSAFTVRSSDDEYALLEAGGGYDYSSLKSFFEKIAKEEDEFRKNNDALTRTIPLSKRLATNDLDTVSKINSFITFWSVDTTIIDATSQTIKRVDDYGLLNNDTLRAILFTEGIDGDGLLRKLLIASIQATGKLRLLPYKSNFFERFKTNVKSFFFIIRSVEIEDPELRAIYDVLYDMTASMFKFDNSGLSAEEVEGFRRSAAFLLLQGILGDYDSIKPISTSGLLIQALSSSKIEFTDIFKQALFKVIIERQETPYLLDRVYSLDGIFAAFKKLITEYNLAPQLEESSTIGILGANITSKNYPDLILPTYEELFRDRWREFALTYSEVGMPNKDSDGFCVTPQDYVHPAIWFYNRSTKSDMYTLLEQNSNSDDPLDAATIAIPFDTERLEEAENLYDTIQTLETENRKDEAKKLEQELASIITEGIEQLRQTDPVKFQNAMTKLEQQQDKFSSARKVWLYVSYKNKPILTRKSTYPGLGGEIYRLAKERNYIIPTDGFKRLAEDTIQLSSGRDNEFQFLRNSKIHTEATIRSTIDQVDDTYFSYRKLFPCFRAYIIDDRGNDILASDSFFNLHRVVSVDVTQDKNDADLAVITVADPLQLTQSSTLPKGYVQTVESNKRDLVSPTTSSSDRIVYDSILNNNVAGYLNRFKITYGRAIVIKAGYEANVKNLKTIFTGKISEIQPGDLFTIICQGWKSELINRQVSFYNDDPSTWGARDLAIQAIAKAAPEGFGQYFTVRETNAFLKGLTDLDSAIALSKSVQNTRSIAIDEYGADNIIDSVERFGRRSIGLGGQAKRKGGTDTRLKNIWYPDTPQYSNLFGWRSNLGCPPDYVNDSWIVPLKPAWEVLQEAARHAWNCIVQVVPYDSKATIFMGHPDQPYYYTRSNPTDVRKFLEYKRKKTNNNNKVLKELIKGFSTSNYYLDDSEKYVDYISSPEAVLNYKVFDPFTKITLRVSHGSGETSIEINPSYTLALRIASNNKVQRILVPGTFITYTAVEDYEETTSVLPLTIYERVNNEVLGEATASVFLRAFYGISTEDIYINYPGIDSIIKQILSPGQLPALNNYTQGTGEGETSYIPDKILSKLPSKYSVLVSLGIGPSGTPGPNYYVELIEDILIDLQKLDKDIPSTNKVISILVDIRELLQSIKPVTGFYEYALNKNEYTSIETNINTALTILKWHIEEYKKQDIAHITAKISYDYSNNLIQNLTNDRTKFKFFAYFFGMYLLDSQGSNVLNDLDKSENRLPPTMQVFRAHHYISSDSDIIENNISATTKEMWNTVVVEHPAKGRALSAAADVADENDIFTAQTIGSHVQWQYWPKNEVSGVIGLQFHPGLTLKNKKVMVKTELNAYSPELVAKLACNHLAEGMRKMYRGTLLFTGKMVKPYDRIVLSDKYNKMKGPIEIESVVHHYSLNTGWVTNIIPEAIADANPGAAILQTAKMEALFGIVFNAIDIVTEALTYATILSALSGSANLEIGKFSLSKPLKGIAKDVITLSPIRMLTTSLKGNAGNLREAARIITNGKSSFAKVGDLLRTFSGPLVYGGSIWTLSETLKGIGSPLYRLSVINSFIKGAKELKSLPVILSPLLHHDRPLVAGLETDSPIWDIYLNGVFYDYKRLQEGAEKVITQIRTVLGEVDFTSGILEELTSRR